MSERKRYLPFLLSALIIIIDQITKALVVKYIPEGSIGASFFGDFLWIIHVRNNAVAFSLGENVPVVLKYVFFVFLPLCVMGALAYLIVSKRTDREFSTLQKWCLAGILGGGCGNLVDRIFRHLRVVDFISVKFYGILGMDRFPTWNVADSSVVISVGLLLITIIADELRKKEKRK